MIYNLQLGDREIKKLIYMANTDNKCSELEVKDFHTGTEDTLGLIYNKQNEFLYFLFIHYYNSITHFLDSIDLIYLPI